MELTRSPRSKPRLLRCVMAVLGAAAIPSAVAASMIQESRPPPLPPARDGNIAIAEELEAARRAGTIEAYDLFLARHPTHPLARAARRERRILSNRNPRPD
jgi:hypothetical protein